MGHVPDVDCIFDGQPELARRLVRFCQIVLGWVNHQQGRESTTMHKSPFFMSLMAPGVSCQAQLLPAWGARGYQHGFYYEDCVYGCLRVSNVSSENGEPRGESFTTWELRYPSDCRRIPIHSHSEMDNHTADTMDPRGTRVYWTAQQPPFKV